MYFFGNSALKKELKNAKGLLWMSRKVDDYRRDVIEPEILAQLRAERAALQAAVNAKPASAPAIEKASEAIDRTLRRCGGDFYPVTTWGENTETFLVAALVVFALRCFIVQPFKIPTNSMYPSYAGLTAKVYADGKTPGGLQKASDFVRYFATNTQVLAPADGEVLIPLSSMGNLEYKTVDAKDFLILPGKRREYTLYVGRTPVTVQTPVEFGLEQVYLDAYFPEQNRKDPSQAYRNLINSPLREERYLHTGKFVKQGEPILDFDIRTGDMLLVDRMRYHFTSPKIGDPVVFPTKDVPGLGETEDVYYIKRLVGTPGDVMEVRDHTLYRNGAPIEGAPAFDANAKQIGEFPGYQAAGRLEPGRTVTVPEGYYFVMGDNSPMSYDGRLWKFTSAIRAATDEPTLGFVPEKDIIGKAIFILYPFSHRWGPAH